MPGGVQFFVYKETALGRINIAEYEVYPYEVDVMRNSLEVNVRNLQKGNPNTHYGWQEVWIKDLPPGAPFQ